MTRFYEAQSAANLDVLIDIPGFWAVIMAKVEAQNAAAATRRAARAAVAAGVEHQVRAASPARGGAGRTY